MSQDTDSEVEVMADFRVIPDTPFWEIPGFLFEAETVEEVEEHKKRIWKALICPDYTSMPNGSSQNSTPETVIKHRVRNNVALLFRGLTFFKDFHFRSRYFADLSADIFPGSGATTIKMLEKVFVQARRAYVKVHGARKASKVAPFADTYIKFLDSPGGDMIATTSKKPEVREKWSALKKRGALFNLAQHRPDDVEDSSDDDEILTLPGEKRPNPTSKKRKKPKSAPQTPSRPAKRPSTSSVRYSTHRARVLSPSSSPPLTRFDSAIGLMSDSTNVSEDELIISSPIYSPDTASFPNSRSADRKITERLQIMDLKISKQEASLVAHDNSIESLKIDASLWNEGRAPAQLTATVKGVVARLETLEGKKKGSEKYISQVVKDQLNPIKAWNEEKLNALDARLDFKLDACVRNLAVEESKRRDFKTTLDKLGVRQDNLRDAVKRHRGDHKKLARDLNLRLEELENGRHESGSDQATDSEEGDDEAGSNPAKSRIAVLEQELAALRQTNEKQGDDLKVRVTAQEEEVVRLKEGERHLKEEIAQLKRELQQKGDEIPGLVMLRVMEAMRSVEQDARQRPVELLPQYTPQGQHHQNLGLHNPRPNRPATMSNWQQGGHRNEELFNRGHGGGDSGQHSSARTAQQNIGHRSGGGSTRGRNNLWST
ncbi:hypothetical protein QBC36DRAFT_353766 [Triangularia setosa]|uniref:Uncharacterized protein n=1 Tax=Triangularia setosa TaxID=2587417 RepID=A0AAN6W5I2_9PEZI|nr:hypothetical protein QBC36DRAFT_353766 [Podospora setosa]